LESNKCLFSSKVFSLRLKKFKLKKQFHQFEHNFYLSVIFANRVNYFDYDKSSMDKFLRAKIRGLDSKWICEIMRRWASQASQASQASLEISLRNFLLSSATSLHRDAAGDRIGTTPGVRTESSVARRVYTDARMYLCTQTRVWLLCATVSS
jgi:hypothetical protein